MKLLAIYGSPRENGNTDILLNEAVKVAGTNKYAVEKLFIRDLNIKPCRGCRACDTTGNCVIFDDMTAKVYPLLETCDIVVISSPVFYYGLPGHLKCMIDRAQCFWAKKYLIKSQISNLKFEIERRGGFICAGATKGEKLFDGVRLTVKYFYDSFNIKYAEELFVRRVDQKGEVLAVDAVKDAYEFGKKITA
ncbi:MAG: hypothetical protein A2252_01725 [Elusimicrobia bacterium RIFOXYA2_FULL_39_19]|nr:MAG: hypothetical protein A2252_01725 [Elusimicrobia bacterium RIFOXYA2_FULL_39_19]